MIFGAFSLEANGVCAYYTVDYVHLDRVMPPLLHFPYIDHGSGRPAGQQLTSLPSHGTPLCLKEGW